MNKNGPIFGKDKNSIIHNSEKKKDQTPNEKMKFNFLEQNKSNYNYNMKKSKMNIPIK